VGCGRYSRQPRPARDGRHIERQRVRKTAKLPEHQPGIALPLTQHLHQQVMHSIKRRFCWVLVAIRGDVEIDALRAGRAFPTQAAEQELVRLRQIKALEVADGAWKDRDHPVLQQGAAQWVSGLRSEYGRRFER
jgi:hypothetical protein